MAAGASSAAAVPDLLELEQLFRDYLQTRRVPRSELKRGLVDLSGLVIRHEETKYDSESARQSKPESQVTFYSEFSNTTSSSQTLVLHTEREVTSTYKVSMQRCFTKEGSLTLSVAPPESIVKLGIGAKRSVQLTGARECTEVDKTKWSLDSTVVVASGTRTRVQIRLEEEEFEGRFSVASSISGRVVFRPRRADGSWNQRLSPEVIDDVRNALAPKDGFQPKSGERAVVFTSEGRIYCRCGVKQEVQLSEEKLQ